MVCIENLLYFHVYVCVCVSDRKPLEVDNRLSLASHPDGRQLLMVMKSSRRDAGIYECVATNPIATITTSCTLSVACKSPL